MTIIIRPLSATAEVSVSRFRSRGDTATHCQSVGIRQPHRSAERRFIESQAGKKEKSYSKHHMYIQHNPIDSNAKGR